MVKRVIKSKIFIFILGFIVACSASIIYAATVASSDVSYSNSSSGSSATTVKAALDDLYTKVDSGPSGSVKYLGSQYCNNASSTKNYTVTFTDSSISKAYAIYASAYTEANLASYDQNTTRAGIALKFGGKWFIANDVSFNGDRAKITSISTSGNTVTLVLNSWNTQRTVYFYAIY